MKSARKIDAEQEVHHAQHAVQVRVFDRVQQHDVDDRQDRKDADEDLVPGVLELVAVRVGDGGHYRISGSLPVVGRRHLFHGHMPSISTSSEKLSTTRITTMIPSTVTLVTD